MSEEIICDFANAINSHDVERICSFMTDDHKFIDANGNEVIGKDNEGWLGRILPMVSRL